nr:glycosyltransferase family 2 [Pithovirus mammoth]
MEQTIPENETITIAILAKEKAHCLPIFLRCIENQTWPKEKTRIYIRTNNNKDETAEILSDWVSRKKDSYLEIYFDSSDVEEKVEQYAPHEWNSLRFRVLGKIRQESIEWARNRDGHYFVVDCDNFIAPETLERMYWSNLPVVGPFLPSETLYANYHFKVDPRGYYADHPQYKSIYFREVKGLIEVDVIHCTYFIRKEVLSEIVYDDDSSRHEYVIFSDNLRKKKIPQYIDNRHDYGFLTFADTFQQLLQVPRIHSLIKPEDLRSFLKLSVSKVCMVDKPNEDC